MSDPQITPLARRLAEENGINWRSLTGTGPDGTIVERDILAYLAKVMAGEITLPPAPDPAPPMPAPAEIPSFAQAQAALEREGVKLGELVPDDLDFDLDLDLSTAQETPSPAEPDLALDHSSKPAESGLEAWEPPASPEPELSWEPAEPSVPLAPSWPLPAEPASATPAEPTWEMATPEVEPAPELEVGLPPEMPDLPPLPSFEPPAEPAVVATPVPEAASAPAALLQLRQRPVSLVAAREAAETLSQAWHQEVGLAALLYRAVDKALADLELTHEPLKGHLEEGTLKGYRVAPAHTLRGTLENLAAAGEAAEGLVVLALEGSDTVLLPGAEVLTLSQPGEGQALLSYSGGLAAEQARALLERVGYYLERPILLA